MENVLSNPLLLDITLSFLSTQELLEARVVCNDFNKSALVHLQGTIRLDPARLLLADPDILLAKADFLSRLGCGVKLIFSNLTLSFPEINEPDDRMEFEERYSTSNPTLPVQFFINHILPIFAKNVRVLRFETRLVEEIDLDRILYILGTLESVHTFSLHITDCLKESGLLRRFVDAFRNKTLLPHLKHLVSFPLPARRLWESRTPEWECVWKDELKDLLFTLRDRINIFDTIGFQSGDVFVDTFHHPWLQAFSEEVQNLHRLNTLRIVFNKEAQYLFNIVQPISKVYLICYTNQAILLARFFQQISSTLSILDLQWKVLLKETKLWEAERVGTRAPLPSLPSLTVLSMNIFSFLETDGQHPFVDNLDDEEWKDTFTPEMMDPFHIQEKVIQGGSGSYPKLETLYLIYPYLRGNRIWDYYFPSTEATSTVKAIGLKKLVISKVRERQEEDWAKFREERLKMLLPNLKMLRYVKSECVREGKTYFWPAETFFPGRGVIEWEDEGNGVWLTSTMWGDYFAKLLQFCLRRSLIQNIFQEKDGLQ